MEYAPLLEEGEGRPLTHAECREIVKEERRNLITKSMPTLLLATMFVTASVTLLICISREGVQSPSVPLANDHTDECGIPLTSSNETRLVESSTFANVFVNATCLAAGGTVDPCDARMFKEYVAIMFNGLRIDYTLGSFASISLLFSLAQAGGIPRPLVRSDESSGRKFIGYGFWWLWMATQTAQLLIVSCNLLLYTATFRSVRERVKPCLTVDDDTGGYRLDAFAWQTAAAQPNLITSVGLVFVYGFALSNGLKVFFQRHDTKADFVDKARRDEYPHEEPQPVPIATILYALVRWVAYAAAFTATQVPGDQWIGTWVLPVVVIIGAVLVHFCAAKKWEELDLNSGGPLKKWEQLYLNSAEPLLAKSMLTTVAAALILPMLFVVRWLSVADGTTGYLVAFAWVAWQEWSLGKQGFTKIAFPHGFFAFNLLPLALPLLHTGGAYLPFALVILGCVRCAYRASRALLEVTVDTNTDSSEVACRVPLLQSFAGPLVWLGSMDHFGTLDGVAKRTAAPPKVAQTSLETLAGGLSSVWVALALSAPVVYAAWAAAGGASKLNLVYAHTFDPVLNLHFSWPALLPAFEKVLDVLQDPTGALWSVFEYAAASIGDVDFDLGSLTRGVEEIAAINLVLGLFKVLATYCRHTFAVIDALYAVRGGTMANEGTVQVHACMAPPEKAAKDGRWSTLLGKVGCTLEEMVEASDITVYGKEVSDVDVASFVEIIMEHAPERTLPRLTNLVLNRNQIGDASMQALANAFIKGAMPSLTGLWVFNNQIGPDGMKALADALIHKAIPRLKNFRVEKNQIGDAGLQMLADAAIQGGLPKLEYLCVQENQTGKTGMQAIANACIQGALPSLRRLFIDSPSQQLMAYCSSNSIKLNGASIPKYLMG